MSFRSPRVGRRRRELLKAAKRNRARGEDGVHPLGRDRSNGARVSAKPRAEAEDSRDGDRRCACPSARRRMTAAGRGTFGDEVGDQPRERRSTLPPRHRSGRDGWAAPGAPPPHSGAAARQQAIEAFHVRRPRGRGGGCSRFAQLERIAVPGLAVGRNRIGVGGQDEATGPIGTEAGQQVGLRPAIVARQAQAGAPLRSTARPPSRPAPGSNCATVCVERDQRAQQIDSDHRPALTQPADGCA